jgi:hypothetical protein
LVLIGQLIRWSLSLCKRAKAWVDLIKLTNLLDEAECYEVIRQLRWPDGVVCLHCRSTELVRNSQTIASGTDSDTCAGHAGIASMT